jgi:hypothetical protein
MDPDPGRPKIRGSGFGSATLVPVVVVKVDGAGLSLVLQVEQVDELQLLLLLDEKVHAVFDLTGHYLWSCFTNSPSRNKRPSYGIQLKNISVLELVNHFHTSEISLLMYYERLKLFQNTTRHLYCTV